MTTPTDPTPPTAATARDALVAKVTSDWDADPYGEYGAAKDRLVRDLDDIIALAAAEATGRVAALEASLNDAYTERNRLVAALIKVGGYPAVTFEDQSEPGWWVVYADTPAGQVSWHVGIRDIGLFLDAPAVIGNPWDGHSTDEKYRRVAALADPTTRTAATARDALALALHAASPKNHPPAPMLRSICASAESHGDAADAILAALPDGWTLAAAEAPGRVAALETLADQWEREAEGSGWMEQQPWRIRRQHASALRAALAAAEATGRVAALEAALRSITRRERRVPAHRGWYIDHSMDLMHDEGDPCVICDALAPAPTPSEPVARCVGEHDWETRHPGDLAVCRRCWTVESDATPATRDE